MVCYYFLVVWVFGGGKMKKVENHDKLIEILHRDIEDTGMENIVVQAGHFPLNYDSDTRALVEDLDIWGEFSEYSFELGCSAARHALDVGKEVELLLLCDDHAYSPTYQVNRAAKKVDGPTWQRMASRFFKRISERDAELPESYQQLMTTHSLPLGLIRRHDHGKHGRHDCLYHSEMILRNSERDVDNNCARAYIEMLEEGTIDLTGAHLISFVPHPCKGHICTAIKEFRTEISSSHVFMETEMNPSRADTYTCDKGVLYRRD